MIKGWDQGVPTMCVGEKCLLLLHPDFGYGAMGSGSIPGESVLQFEVELLGFEAIDNDDIPSDPAEKLIKAKSRADVAKELFTTSKFEEALVKYLKAVLIVQHFTEGDLAKDAQLLYAQILSNLALCLLKLNRFDEAGKRGQEAFDVLEKQQIADPDLRKKVANRTVRGLVGSGFAEQAVIVGEKMLKKITVDDVAVVTNEIIKAKQ